MEFIFLLSLAFVFCNVDFLLSIYKIDLVYTSKVGEFPS